MTERPDERPERDPLEALRASVREARAAAEQLADGLTPPRGWEADDGHAEAQARETASELRALVDLVHALRRTLPDQLREQLVELARQLLLVLRALIEWLLARIERGGQSVRGDQPRVEDIPIV
jgi:hypothetical protein